MERQKVKKMAGELMEDCYKLYSLGALLNFADATGSEDRDVIPRLMPEGSLCNPISNTAKLIQDITKRMVIKLEEMER